MICTLGLAVAQPFLLNAVTTVAARWFPMEERATAGGLALVAGFIGIAIGQVASPLLVTGYGIPAMQMIFGGGGGVFGGAVPDLHPRGAAYPALPARAGNPRPDAGRVEKHA